MHTVGDHAESGDEQPKGAGRRHGYQNGQGGMVWRDSPKVHREHQSAQKEAHGHRGSGQKRRKHAPGQDHRELAARRGQKGSQPPVVALAEEDAAQGENAGVGAKQEGIAHHPPGEIGGTEAVGGQKAVEGHGHQRIKGIEAQKFHQREGGGAAFIKEQGLGEKSSDHSAHLQRGENPHLAVDGAKERQSKERRERRESQEHRQLPAKGRRIRHAPHAHAQ